MIVANAVIATICSSLHLDLSLSKISGIFFTLKSVASILDIAPEKLTSANLTNFTIDFARANPLSVLSVVMSTLPTYAAREMFSRALAICVLIERGCKNCEKSFLSSGLKSFTPSVSFSSSSSSYESSFSLSSSEVSSSVVSAFSSLAGVVSISSFISGITLVASLFG